MTSDAVAAIREALRDDGRTGRFNITTGSLVPELTWRAKAALAALDTLEARVAALTEALREIASVANTGRQDDPLYTVDVAISALSAAGAPE